MSTNLRFVAGIVSLALAIWMLALFLTGSTLHFPAASGETASLTADCDPLLAQLLGERIYDYHSLQSPGGAVPSYVVTSGQVPSAAGAELIDVECSRQRTASAGLIGILAVPTTLFAAGAFFGRKEKEWTPPMVPVSKGEQ